MIITIIHPDLGIGKTRLTADVAAEATSSTVENNNNFTTNDYAVFGHLGQEKTEIVKITSVTGNTTLGHTTGPVFDHSARTPISEIKYNQIKVYTSDSQTGTYSLLATIDIDADEEYTLYDDTTGTSSTWYKIKYYNSTSTFLSDYSDPIQGTGYTSDSLFDMTDEVLEEFGDPDCKEVSRDQIRRYLRAGVRSLTKELIKYYPDYRQNYTTQALTSGTAAYDLPTCFLAFQRVDVNFSGSTASDAYKVENFEREEAGYPDTSYQESDPRICFRGTQFVIRPTPANSAGYAFLWYWDYPEEMTEQNDEHGLPYGAREPLIQYALYRLWMGKDREKGTDYYVTFKAERADWLDFVGQMRQTKSTRRVLPTFGVDLYDN